MAMGTKVPRISKFFFSKFKKICPGAVAVVKLSTHNHRTEGSNPGTVRETKAKK
jgi:hypothetical protein